MLSIRHRACNQRLFDSEFDVEEMSGEMSDISIKCPRCSRDKKRDVIVGLRLKLPKKQAPSVPERIHCSNLNCLHRLLDLSLPYILRNQKSHIAILCPTCKELNHVQLLNIVEVE
jgi:phage FluMu protein Com